MSAAEQIKSGQRGLYWTNSSAAKYKSTVTKTSKVALPPPFLFMNI